MTHPAYHTALPRVSLYDVFSVSTVRLLDLFIPHTACMLLTELAVAGRCIILAILLSRRMAHGACRARRLLAGGNLGLYCTRDVFVGGPDIISLSLPPSIHCLTFTACCGCGCCRCLRMACVIYVLHCSKHCLFPAYGVILWA